MGYAFNQIAHDEKLGGVHGVTAQFPTLQSNIDYEEGNWTPTCSSGQPFGYPRFVIHPYVEQIARYINSEHVLLLQSQEAAHRFKEDFLKDIDALVFSSSAFDEDHAVVKVPAEDYETACKRLTSSGFCMSSRKAERALKGTPINTYENVGDAREKYAELLGLDNTTLIHAYSSGMAAVYELLNSFREEGKHFVVVGNAYTDILRQTALLPRVWNMDPTRYFNEDDEVIIDSDTAAVIHETIINPTTRVPNVDNLVKQAHAKDVCVIADTTFATPHHYNAFEHGVDVVIESATKALSRSLNVMGGFTAINPKSIRAFGLSPTSPMDPGDAKVLYENMQSFKEEIGVMAANAQSLAEHLTGHPLVEKVYYPGLTDHPDHAVARDILKNGFGHVMGIKLKNEEKNAHIFYDTSGFPIKGPSLGSHNSILMAYTVLAHWHELDQSAKRGLSKFFMRLSVGTEPLEKLVEMTKTQHNL